MPSAAIVTIGNELTSGDVENTNASWLARRLEALGVSVGLIAAVPDRLEAIAALVREQAARADYVLVTGGLGGTPDDVTREAVAVAFGVERAEVADVAKALRRRFARDPEYAARWALLPRGARPLENPLGGAPGFVLANVYALPGLPSEMEALFESIAGELATGRPIASWRRRYRTTESAIVAALEDATRSHPEVLVGSYPTFGADGPHVEVVVKSADPGALAAAVSGLEAAIEEAIG